MKSYVHDSIFKAVQCGERVIWHGQPRQGVLFRGSDVLQIPFCLMWGGFAIFWEVSVLSSPGAPLIMKLWGIPFVLMGLYLIGGRFLYDAARRSRMHYAVTDQRVLIVCDFPRHSEVSLPLSNLPLMSLNIHSDGGGVITFGQQPLLTGADSWSNGKKGFSPQFELSANVRDVFELMRRVQRGEFSEFERATSRAA